MERILEQDSCPVWKVISIPLILGLVAVGLLLAYLYFVCQINVSDLLMGGVVIALVFGLWLVLFVLILRPRATWLLTDEGLKRVKASGEQQTIHWEQIYDMTITTNVSMVIRWIEFDRNQKENSNGEHTDMDNPDENGVDHREVLWLRKADSQALISLWQKYYPPEMMKKGQVFSRSAASRSGLHTESVRRHRDQLFKERVSGRILYKITIAAGFAFICWGCERSVWQYLWQYPSYSWPTVEGKIVSQQYRRIPGGRNRSDTAELGLSYKYMVADQTYSSGQISLWDQKYHAGEKEVRSFAAQHREGTMVKIYYNPERPSEAVLLPGADWRGTSAIFLSGLFLAIVGILLVKQSHR